MVSFFDYLVVQNDLDRAESPTELLIGLAKACVGIHESGGNNEGSEIEIFQSSCGTPQGQSWCLDFLQSLIDYVEYSSGIVSPVFATQGVCDLWNRTPMERRLRSPMPGDIILWRHGKTIHGHCGLVIAESEESYETIEGNTTDENEINREGDGVYSKSRKKEGSSDFVLLGFIRCFPG